MIGPNVELWFTDGSRIHDCFGADIYGPLHNYRKSIQIGSISTVFFCRVMAILMCAEILLTKNLIRRRINVCSDSRVDLAALAKPTTELCLVWE
jgi:hypothetical protein